MQNKKIYAALIALAFFLQMVPVALAASPVATVSFTSNPVSIAPGGDGFIEMEITNSGTVAISSINIRPTSTDPGIGIDSTVVDLGSLDVSDKTSAIFKVSVPANTASGLYRVNFDVNYCQDSNSNCITSNRFAIVDVESQSPLIVKSVSPSTLNIGSNQTLVFTIENNGNSELTNVVLTWSDPTDSILPLGSSNRIVIHSIGAGQSLDIPVPVITSPSVIPKAYPISVTMQYFDKSGTLQNITSTVGLIVGGATDFSVDLQDYSGGVATLSIANIGVNSATSTLVSLGSQKDFNVVGSHSSFLGNLNPGDSTIASFNVAPKSFNQSSNMLHVSVDYTDTSGIRANVQKDVFVDTSGALQQSSGTARGQRAGTQNFTYVYIIVAIASIAAGFFVWRRWKKKHQHLQKR